MTYMEKKKLNSRLMSLEKKFDSSFPSCYVNGTKCYKNKQSCLFLIDAFNSENALVIEYADNEDEAKLNRFEDGDLFYLDELDENEMFARMLNEINN